MNIPDQTIELVKKWLDNPDSVSKEERKANRKSAYYAAGGANAAAAYAAYYADAADAEKWIKEYEKLAHKE